METQTKQSITISTQSILNELKAYEEKPEDAFLEYIWNSFDANASRVDINYSFSHQLDGIALSKPSVSIVDDGDGWDLSETSTIEVFLESKKRFLKKSFMSLPHGSKGVGRFTFFSFAASATWKTTFGDNKYTLVLEKQNLNSYSLEQTSDTKLGNDHGTSVEFNVNSDKLHEGFFISTLPNRILCRMAWFLMLYPDKSIYINGEVVDVSKYIDAEQNVIVKVDEHDISLKMIKWRSSLADKENSKLYYINSLGKEVFKRPTGLNNKADIFFHSAYVTCSEFDGYTPSREVTEETETSLQVTLVDGDKAKFINKVKEEVYERLTQFRQPHIESSSDEFIEEWKKNDQYPDVAKYGVDPEQYHDLVKQSFIAVPSLYLGTSEEHRKIILNLLASLMGTSDGDLIVKILGQVYELDQHEKDSLNEILNRTTLKNILSTVKELEHRLQVIEDLDKILNDTELYKNTLEVEHLQRILNESFWIFGDEYQLVIDTEGTIRTAIKKWAKAMLGIDDFDPESKSRKELDLLLSKKIEYGNGRILNIVVELKRPSIVLGDKEYTQISEYRDKLLAEPACNAANIEWVFILIGSDYDKSIERKIESMKSWGEMSKGLTEYVDSENTKIYVRKWTSIINGDLRPRYRNLSDKLNIQLDDRDGQSVIEIVDDIVPLVKSE